LVKLVTYDYILYLFYITPRFVHASHIGVNFKLHNFWAMDRFISMAYMMITKLHN